MEQKKKDLIPYIFPIARIHTNSFENISEKNRFEKLTDLFLKLRVYLNQNPEYHKAIQLYKEKQFQAAQILFERVKNTTQSEASIDSAMAKFDVDRFNEEVGKIVKNQLVNSFTGKNISVKMLLSPESLGQVEVDLLFSKDSEIQITLRTENAEVAKLMQANATVLRDQLAIEHKGIVALNINDSRTAEFGFQGNQRDEANREKNSVFDESDSGESNNALEKSSISGDGSNSLIDTFA